MTIARCCAIAMIFVSISSTAASSDSIIPIEYPNEFKSIVLELDQKRTQATTALMHPINSFSKVNALLSDGKPTPCSMSDILFECIKISKSVGEPEANTSTVFLAPIPEIGIAIIKPDLSLSKTGTKVTSTATFSFSQVVGESSNERPFSGWVESGWISLESIDKVVGGQEALNYLMSLVGRVPTVECVDVFMSEGGCSRYFRFRALAESGVARCNVMHGLGIVADPNGCSIQAITLSGQWFIAALSSPRPVFGGRGDAFGEVYCAASNKRAIDIGMFVAALKSALAAPPFDINLNSRLSAGTAAIAGQRRGVVSEILRKAKFGTYYENKTIFGSATVNPSEITLLASMFVTVTRTRLESVEKFQELSDNESDKYFTAVTTLLQARLNKELKAELVCRMGVF